MLYFYGPSCFSVTNTFNTSQVIYWVETKGKTLEEIDAIFEGEKHSSVPDVELLRRGKEHIDVGEVEQQIVAEVLATKNEWWIGSFNHAMETSQLMI